MNRRWNRLSTFGLFCLSILLVIDKMKKDEEITKSESGFMDKNHVDMLVVEYKFLREEIMILSSRHNGWVTFTVTSVTGILGYTLLADIHIYVTLLPFAILIPMAVRIAYSRRTMMKMSAYMIVFLEPKLTGINWETANSTLLDKHRSKPSKFKVLAYTRRYNECLIC